MGCVRLTTLQYNKYFIGRFSISKTIIEIRVSQNLIKLRGKDAHKTKGIKGGERTGVNCVTGEGGFQHWL